MFKFQNDKVSFELDLRATKAQEEIHYRTNATEWLSRQNCIYRKEISHLATAECYV